MIQIDRTDQLTKTIYPWNYTRRTVSAVIKWDDCRSCPFFRKTRKNNFICERTGRLLIEYESLIPLVSWMFYSAFKIPDFCPILNVDNGVPIGDDNAIQG